MNEACFIMTCRDVKAFMRAHPPTLRALYDEKFGSYQTLTSTVSNLIYLAGSRPSRCKGQINIVVSISYEYSGECYNPATEGLCVVQYGEVCPQYIHLC